MHCVTNYVIFHMLHVVSSLIKKHFPLEFSFVIRKIEVEEFSVKRNIHGCNNCNGQEWEPWKLKSLSAFTFVFHSHFFSVSGVWDKYKLRNLKWHETWWLTAGIKCNQYAKINWAEWNLFSTFRGIVLLS